jgi:hypothetical protein
LFLWRKFIDPIHLKLQILYTLHMCKFSFFLLRRNAHSFNKRCWTSTFWVYLDFFLFCYIVSHNFNSSVFRHSSYMIMPFLSLT